MEKSRVTVLLAVYNGAKYIESQLESLLSQTRSIDQLIVGDDGSIDGSLEIVQRYIKEHNLDGKWVVQKNQVNKGHAGNFINLCYSSEGDYVFFCDQDDIWMPDKVESMINIMEQRPQIQLLYANVINTPHPEIRYELEIDSRFDKKILNVPFTAENFFFKGLGCAACVRGTFLKAMLPYWTEGWEHDMFFWACAIMLDSGYCYNYPVIWRRIHEGNASINARKTLQKRITQVEQSLARPKKIRKLLTDYHINSVEKKKFVEGYAQVLKRRDIALKKRNLLLAGWNLINGTQYYLHKEKGAILDIVLIIFKRYPINFAKK